MAGNYPDVPSWRIPYHLDGTRLLQITYQGTVTELTSADILSLNNETDATDNNAYVPQGSGPSRGALVLMFPRLMDIDAMFIVVGQEPQYKTFAWSADTTNGIDGTWTAFTPTFYTTTTPTVPAYRTGIWSGTIGGARAVKVMNAYVNRHMYSWHLFGEPTAGEDANRLQIWHPTLDQRLDAAALDWGNVPRGSSADRTFRVKNLSSTLTANSVRLSFVAPTDTTPSVAGQFTVSDDGTNFYAQRTITSIAPGAISSVYTVRRTTPSNAVLSVWTAMLAAEATAAWT